ncbi:MAG: hypothetical protein IJC71_01870 [Clostridia bacterium]|nr:hypothetical protein [Clostridia bacterium]
MMKNLSSFFRKTAAVLLVAAMMTTPALSAIPVEYWQYHQPFTDASAALDYKNILHYGALIEEIMLRYPLDTDTGAILGNVYSRSANAYTVLAQYEKAAEMHRKYIPYAEFLGFKDAVIVSTAAARRLDVNTMVYVETADTSVVPDYNALHEPDSGIYFGRVSETSQKNESAALFYFEFLDDKLSDYAWHLDPIAKEGNRAIEICMNMPRENDSLKQVMDPKNDAYIVDTMKYIATLGCPVLLRIGGEMNVWGNLADPELFKQAFIKIVTAAREYAPNAAAVFAPNFASNFYAKVSDYYPGDEYVDWVGVSLYATAYMDAATQRTANDAEKIFYSNGEYANMIAQMAEIVELYGDRKPIMITESGVSHSIVKETDNAKVDLGSFAAKQMEIFYTYVNMVYPQVKCIMYFDTNFGEANEYDFSLSGSPDLEALYNNLTADSVYSTGVGDKAEKAYVKAYDYKGTDALLRLHTYAVLPGLPETTVTYSLDGTVICTTKTMPYTCEIVPANIADGEHSLVVSVSAANGYAKTMEYKLTKAEGAVTIIDPVVEAERAAAAAQAAAEAAAQTTAPQGA